MCSVITEHNVTEILTPWIYMKSFSFVLYLGNWLHPQRKLLVFHFTVIDANSFELAHSRWNIHKTHIKGAAVITC